MPTLQWTPSTESKQVSPRQPNYSGQSLFSGQSTSFGRTYLVPRGTKTGTPNSATAPSRQTLLPTKTTRSIPPPPPPPPSSPAARAALYLNVCECEPDIATASTIRRHLNRGCSIVVRRDPRVNKFTEYFCQATSLGDGGMRFFSIPDLPDPRQNAPGLISMDFIAWISLLQIKKLDSVMRIMETTVERNATQNCWINEFLRISGEAKLLTPLQQQAARAYKDQALNSAYTGIYPNEQAAYFFGR
jgi:hypothetical protein